MLHRFAHNIECLTNVNGTLFFTTALGQSGSGAGIGSELWKSDGTPEGTVLVKRISATAIGPGARHFTNANGTLFFTADDGVNGEEVWRSDGTAEGTVMVKDTRLGPDGSDPEPHVSVSGNLFFGADDGIHGRELWVLPADCNGNDAWDHQDIENGSSSDIDSNGIPDECEPLPFLRGDCNADGGVDLSDASCILNWQFSGAPPPGCLAATNTNGDRATDIANAIYLLNSLFLGGPPPVAPFPACGPGTDTDMTLGCEMLACP